MQKSLQREDIEAITACIDGDPTYHGHLYTSLESNTKQQLARLAFSAFELESYEECAMAVAAYLDAADDRNASEAFAVLLVGIQVHLLCWQSQTALGYAEKAMELAAQLDANDVAVPISQYYMGVVYRRLAVESIEPEHYNVLLQQAKLSLQNANAQLQDVRISLALARLSAEEGDFDVAAKLVDRCLTLDEGNLEVWHLKLMIHYHQGHTEQVVDAFNETFDELAVNKLNYKQADAYLGARILCFYIECAGNLEDFQQLLQLYHVLYATEPVAVVQVPSLEQLAVKYIFDFKEYPVINSLCPTSMFQSNTKGSLIQSPFYPAVGQTKKPLLGSLKMVKAKQRYIEIWLVMSQLSRKLNKFDDALFCCGVAQQAEAHCADVECEFGMIALTQHLHAAKEDIPEYMVELIESEDKKLELVPEGELEVDFKLKFVPVSVVAQACRHFEAAIVYDGHHLPSRMWIARILMLEDRIQLAKFELDKAINYGRFRGCKDWLCWHWYSKCCTQTDEIEVGAQALEFSRTNRKLCAFDVESVLGFEQFRLM